MENFESNEYYKEYNSERTLFSLHIPKCAGTSFNEILRNWFGSSNIEYHYRGLRGETPQLINQRPNLCIHGHFNRIRGIGVRTYYPDSDQFIVMIRDPYDRFVSAWRYLHFQIRNGVNIPEFDDRPELGKWLDRRRSLYTEREDPFSFLAQLADTVDPANPEAVLGRQYLAVGITERYAESVNAFARVLGRRAPSQLTRLNQANDPHRIGDPSGDLPDLRSEYRRAFPLEYAVYEAAQKRLDASVDLTL